MLLWSLATLRILWRWLLLILGSGRPAISVVLTGLTCSLSFYISDFSMRRVVWWWLVILSIFSRILSKVVVLFFLLVIFILKLIHVFHVSLLVAAAAAFSLIGAVIVGVLTLVVALVSLRLRSVIVLVVSSSVAPTTIIIAFIYKVALFLLRVSRALAFTMRNALLHNGSHHSTSTSAHD